VAGAARARCRWRPPPRADRPRARSRERPPRPHPRRRARRGRPRSPWRADSARPDRGESASQDGAQRCIGDPVERRHDLAGALATPPRQQREQHQAGGEQIRALVDATLRELLRRHELRRTAGRGGGGARAGEPSETKVEEHHPVPVALRPTKALPGLMSAWINPESCAAASPRGLLGNPTPRENY
jgi:hypothetical protein